MKNDFFEMKHTLQGYYECYPQLFEPKTEEKAGEMKDTGLDRVSEPKTTKKEDGTIVKEYPGGTLTVKPDKKTGE